MIRSRDFRIWSVAFKHMTSTAAPQWHLHPSTGWAQSCLASMNGREPVLSAWNSRWPKNNRQGGSDSHACAETTSGPVNSVAKKSPIKTSLKALTNEVELVKKRLFTLETRLTNSHLEASRQLLNVRSQDQLSGELHEQKLSCPIQKLSSPTKSPKQQKNTLKKSWPPY